MVLRSSLSKWRAIIGPTVMSLGAVLTLISSFSSWLSAGRTGRSSFELLGVIQRLGFVPNGATKTVVQAWPMMPLMLAVGVVTVWWGWRRIGAAIAAVGALFAGAVGGAVAFAAPETSGVDLSGAPRLTAVGACIVLLGSLLTASMRPGKTVARNTDSSDRCDLA